MSNPWFRLYAEFAHDPKVQMMSEAMQRRYIMLLCMRCSNNIVTLHETEIAFHMRITEAELADTKTLFITKGFIDSDWNLLNWEKRQFKSDSSRERVSRHRAKKKEESNTHVTLQVTKGNALDTDTDTDTDIKKHTKKESTSATNSETDGVCVGDVGEPLPTSPQPDPASPPTSLAGAIAAYCRSQGLNASPSAKLKQLIEQGAQMHHFVDAVPITKEKKAAFAYTLGIVERWLAEEKNTAQSPPARAAPRQNKPEKFYGMDYIRQRNQAELAQYEQANHRAEIDITPGVEPLA